MRYRLRVAVILYALILSSLKLPAQGGLGGGAYNIGPSGAQVAAATAGAAAVIGAGVGLTIYLVHRSHTSLSGCVQSVDGLTRVLNGNQSWALVSAPADLPVNHRVELRGKKSRAASGERTFTVSKLAHDRGNCS